MLLFCNTARHTTDYTIYELRLQGISFFYSRFGIKKNDSSGLCKRPRALFINELFNADYHIAPIYAFI